MIEDGALLYECLLKMKDHALSIAEVARERTRKLMGEARSNEA